MSINPEEYHVSGEDESPETGTTYNPTTGEPERTPHDLELAQEEAEAANPNAASSAGLEGDMGISSERTGPADETGTAGLGDLDTVTVGTAKGRTHGSTPTTRPAHDVEEQSTDVEERPDDVPSHRLSNKNPGHSGGTPGQSSD